jgi:NitT/TauT family transport system substrate-binding protein
MKRPIVLVTALALSLAIAATGWFAWMRGREKVGSPISSTVPTEAAAVRFPTPVPTQSQACFFLAQDSGYYREAGLSVRFDNGSEALNPISTVAAGQDDFGVIGGPDTLIVGRSKGLPLVAIAVLQRNSNFPCLLTLKKSGITRVDQLQGKDVGFFYGHISTDVLRTLFRKQGVKVNEVDVGMDYSQLVSGKLAAQWAFTVTAGINLPAKGIEVNFIRTEDYGIVTHGYTIFTTERMIKERPEVVKRFLAATLRGVRSSVESPGEANKAIMRHDPTLKEDIGMKRQLAVNAVTSDTERYPAGYMDGAMFEETYGRLLEEGVLATPFDVSAVYTTRFLGEIYGRKFN